MFAIALPQLSPVQWIVAATSLVGGVAIILRVLVQFGLPLQSSVKAVDILLKILNGVAMNPNAALARMPPPDKNQVLGKELKPGPIKGTLVPLFLICAALASSSSCAWFKSNGAAAAVDCATTEVADAILVTLHGGSRNAVTWQDQLGAYLGSTVDCVLRKWLASSSGQAGLAGASPSSMEASRRAQLWLNSHPQ